MSVQKQRKNSFDYEEFLIEEKIKNATRSFEHPSYLLERRLCQAIMNMDNRNAFQLLDKINSVERARLSENPLRSIKNSLIASTTIFTRAAIDGGLDSETAFILSDLFIRKIENLRGIQEAESLEYDIVFAFIDALKNHKDSKESLVCSPIILRAREYIRKYSMRRLSLKEIAEFLNVHPNYLSTQFTKECNQSVMGYYDEMRVDAILHYLQYTELSLSEIAVILDFSSFSHFSSYFKKHCGKSPREYRNDMLDSEQIL